MNDAFTDDDLANAEDRMRQAEAESTGIAISLFALPPHWLRERTMNETMNEPRRRLLRDWGPADDMEEWPTEKDRADALAVHARSPEHHYSLDDCRNAIQAEAARTADRPSLRAAILNGIDERIRPVEWPNGMADRVIGAIDAALRQALEGEEADLRPGRSTEDDPQENPDRVPSQDEAPYCRFPRWEPTDCLWVCCHGGSGCGGCRAWPQNCREATSAQDR